MEQDGKRSPAPWYLLASIVVLGLGLRVYHYLLNPGVWMDELFLLRNIVHKTYGELLGPLACDQAAPPLFLWLEHTVLLTLGDSTLSLRLIPLLASCGALLLLPFVARAVVRAGAAPWALLLYASSDKLVDHTIEAKQYLMDAFVAVLVPALFFATRQWPLGRRMLLFAALSPLVIFLAFPGCFVMGGLLAALFLEMRREPRTNAAWLGYAFVAASTMAAFGLLILGPIRAQHTLELAGMWTNTFPNWNEPWTIPWWCVTSNINLFDHSFRPLGGTLLPLAMVGAVSLWRRGCKTELILVTTPVLLSLVAALMRAYPYDSRVSLFAVAPLAILIGEGTLVGLHWTRSILQNPVSWTRRAATRSLITVALVLIALPICLSGYRVVKPWPRLVFPWPEPASAIHEYSRS